jgi:DNA-binding NtrC family response regulator
VKRQTVAVRRDSVLLVEDDASAREALSELLRDDGFTVRGAATLADARAALAGEAVDAVLLDLRLPDGDGALLLEELALRRGAPPTIVVTAYGSGSRAIAAMRAGAFDYVQKPLDPTALVETLRAAIARGRRTGARTFASGARADGERIVGSGPAMQRVFKLVGRVAASDATVLLLGESGTGKELVARAIHDYSPRASGPFVAVNCAAVPEPLLEAELFGAEKGAYTGAVTSRPGRFEAARGGTLFLDEIAELAPATQAKLLRALQERSVERLGSNKPVAIDARIVAATNRRLSEDVATGRFREDLFYRLSVVAVDLPPLRERVEDIPALIDHVLARAARRDVRATSISPAAVEALTRRTWPGNVRELENALERALVLSGGAIDLEHVAAADDEDARWRAHLARHERALLADDAALARAAAEAGVSPAFLARRRARLDGTPFA